MYGCQSQKRVLIHFFFSSRRRHTRLTCDWSSDVCSSDLAGGDDVPGAPRQPGAVEVALEELVQPEDVRQRLLEVDALHVEQDRKSTRLNSSHMSISYAVFCLKKKKKNKITQYTENKSRVV